jgi:hypothetical protein
MAKKKLTDNELVMDGYKALYAAATPPADFEKLINECCKFIDRDGKQHITEAPLTIEECAERGWQKDIGYMDYELDEDTYREIVESKIKEHKLTGFRAEAFKNTMYLGAGPAFKKRDE